MSLIKKLIQRLLDSRTTPAQAGHASKPGSAVPVDYNPSASVDNWGPVLSNSTAVSDGYIWATGRTTSDKGFFQINTQALQITTTGTSNPGGEILNLFTPVSKGQLFSVYGRYLEQVTVRLVKTIGGGVSALKNALLQGGAICLSNLCSSLRRSSLQARRSGYRTSETRIIQKVSPCLCLTKGTISSMSHHVMGCLSWRKAAQARCTLSATAETIGSTLIRNILTPIIKDYLCKLIRAKQYLIKPRPITEAASAVVNSSLLCQDLNKLEGGASC